jgi:hypothetical protein
VILIPRLSYALFNLEGAPFNLMTHVNHFLNEHPEIFPEIRFQEEILAITGSGKVVAMQPNPKVNKYVNPCVLENLTEHLKNGNPKYLNSACIGDLTAWEHLMCAGAKILGNTALFQKDRYAIVHPSQQFYLRDIAKSVGYKPKELILP